MDKTQGLKVTRRSILKTIPALSAISAGSSFFTKAACAQEPLEDGYTICDNCNQMPMCGIHFQRQGNTVVSVGNGKNTAASCCAIKPWLLYSASTTPTACSIR